jgi:ABC-type multidrug transport system fused ATPase/permease subunit
VPQETFLFDDTVRGNVTLGRDVDDGEIWAALALAQADRFVRALPDELDTMVGERGTVLSGGMRQRLALARALVRRPRLLVLDDATSSVDPRIEQAILAGLKDAGRDDRPATVVIVAHRRATIALADEVVFVDGGRVVARGPHHVLLREQPRYVELVSAYDAAEERRQAERAAATAEDDESDVDDEFEGAAR